MTQYDFDKLLEKYLNGACTPEEELLLDEWSNRQLNHVSTPLTEEETPITKKQIWKRIQKSSLPPLSIRWFSWTRLAIAATIALLLSATTLWFYGVFQDKSPQNAVYSEKKQKGIEVTNTTPNAQTIPLADGSSVELQPNSTLTFPEKFGDHNRIVYLKGEGFFSVKRDTTKPFYVYAGDLVTKVLGTSFRVKAYDSNVKVIVKSGKVAVFKQNKEQPAKAEQQAMILTPNQQAEYKSTAKHVNKSVQEIPTLLVQEIKMKNLHFNDAPVATVFKALKEAYGIDIIYDEAIFHNCIITTSLTDEPLLEKMTIICKTIGAKYRDEDAKIIVTGRGCQ